MLVTMMIFTMSGSLFPEEFIYMGPVVIWRDTLLSREANVDSPTLLLCTDNTLSPTRLETHERG